MKYLRHFKDGNKEDYYTEIAGNTYEFEKNYIDISKQNINYINKIYPNTSIGSFFIDDKN